MHIVYISLSLLSFVGTYVAMWRHDMVAFFIFFVTCCAAFKLAEANEKRSRAAPNGSSASESQS